MKVQVASLFLLLALRVEACPPQATAVKFQGTIFATHPFQVQGRTIYFFRGSEDAMALAYNPVREQWCYRTQHAVASRPAAGCFKKAARFLLRQGAGRTIARLHMIGKRLSAVLLDEKNADSGKRLVFTDNSNGEVESLDIRGWNCPNPRFLSCAGAQLQTYHEAGLEGRIAKDALKEAELSKNLGHYWASCSGLRELAFQTRTHGHQ